MNETSPQMAARILAGSGGWEGRLYYDLYDILEQADRMAKAAGTTIDERTVIAIIIAWENSHPGINSYQ